VGKKPPFLATKYIKMHMKNDETAPRQARDGHKEKTKHDEEVYFSPFVMRR
jgi:hypothetical protein